MKDWTHALGAGMMTVVMGCGLPQAESRAQPPGAPPSFVSLAAQASPAVVNIDIVRRVPRRLPDWFGDGSGMTRVQRGVGSGFVIDPAGLVVTNNHVVQGHPELTVTLSDGRSFRGKVLGADPVTDLALVSIPAKGLAALALGNSDTVQVGEWVLAIGSPLGLQQTVTAGIISTVRREVTANERVGFLQTDAAINPGNSGGPLINMAGQAVGINTAIAEGATGIGFAVPVNELKRIMTDLRLHGRVVRPWLGISFASLTPELVEQFPQFKGQKGLVVAEVIPGGPAAKAGLKSEDVLVALDGQPLTHARDLVERMSVHQPGDVVTLVFLRHGVRHSVRVKLKEMPASATEPTEEP